MLIHNELAWLRDKKERDESSEFLISEGLHACGLQSS